jgi:hypothetical protein
LEDQPLDRSWKSAHLRLSTTPKTQVWMPSSALRPPNATPLLVQLEGTLRAKKCAEQCVSFARDQTIRNNAQRDASDCMS